MGRELAWKGRSDERVFPVRMGVEELAVVLALPPLDLKVYLALRAFAEDGVAEAPLHTWASRLRYRLRSRNDAMVYDSAGERVSGTHSDQQEIEALRKALRRLESQMLIFHEKAVRADGRAISRYTFALVVTP